MERSRPHPEKGSNSSKKAPASSSRIQEKSRREAPSSSAARKTLELLDKMKLSSALDSNCSRIPPPLSQTRTSSSSTTKHGPSTNCQSTADRSSSRHHPSQTSSTQKGPSYLASKLDSSSNHHSNAYSRRSTAESSSHDLASSSKAQKSVHVTDFDRKMAFRQPLFDTLPPNERKKQEAWAQAQLELSGTCVAGFGWDRAEGGGGYICRGTNHMVTDELIAEGKGGYFSNSNINFLGTGSKDWAGPTYPVDFEKMFMSARSRTGTHNLPKPLHSPASSSTLQKIQKIQPAPVPALYPSSRYTARFSNLNSPTPSTRSTNSAAAAQTTLKSAFDQKMASRQRQYESLSATERVTQDNWAYVQLRTLPRCAAGYEWYRIPGGYRCNGGRHMVTDNLLADGKGGCFSMSFKSPLREKPIWEGPFYGKEILDHMWGPGRTGSAPMDSAWYRGRNSGSSESSIFARRK